MLWHDVTNEKLKESHNGIKPTFILMYLAIVKEDYGYNMEKEFKVILEKFEKLKKEDQDEAVLHFLKTFTDESQYDKILGIVEVQHEEILKALKTLQKSSQISRYMNEMKKVGLLLSRDEVVGPHKRVYFQLNPRVLRNPEGQTGPYHIKYRGKLQQWSIANKQIEDFLNELRKQPKDTYYDNWTKIKIFDFRTFIYFLFVQANELKLDEMKNELLTHLKNEHYSQNDNDLMEKFGDILRCPHLISPYYRDLIRVRPIAHSPNLRLSIFYGTLQKKLEKKVKLKEYFGVSYLSDLDIPGRKRPRYYKDFERLDPNNEVFSKRYEPGVYPDSPALRLVKTTGVEGVMIKTYFRSDVIVALEIDTHTKYENNLIFNALFSSREAIEREIGMELEWIRAGGGDAFQIRKKIVDGGINGTEKSDEIQEAMIDVMIKMEQAFRPRIKEIKALL